jgi:hypothetical protein
MQTAAPARRSTFTRMLLARIAIAGVLGLVTIVLVARQSTSAVTPLQPNLTPFPAAELRIESAGGLKLLRLSTTSWNNGAGNLELVGGATDPVDDEQDVYQRIYNSDGTSAMHLAGTFLWHEAHQHIHFDDYADYVLEPLVGPLTTRVGTKQTFCIMDTDAINTSLPGAPQSAQYTACASQLQGMSIGWADTYGYWLAGQSIDITGLPNGDYRLKIVIDPENNILESNDEDNTSFRYIRITNNSVTNSPDGDVDQVPDVIDNCPAHANTSQADFDADAAGDVCDPDDDGDSCADATEIANQAVPQEPDNPLDRSDFPDIGADGDVGFHDFLAMVASWNRTSGDPAFEPFFDFDGDDMVGFSDFVAFAGTWNRTCS